MSNLWRYPSNASGRATFVNFDEILNFAIAILAFKSSTLTHLQSKVTSLIKSKFPLRKTQIFILAWD